MGTEDRLGLLDERDLLERLGSGGELRRLWRCLLLVGNRIQVDTEAPPSCPPERSHSSLRRGESDFCDVEIDRCDSYSQFPSSLSLNPSSWQWRGSL